MENNLIEDEGSRTKHQTELERLRAELLESKEKENVQLQQIDNLNAQLAKYCVKLSFLENQNESHQRIIERSNAENDDLLLKLDSISIASQEKIDALQNDVERLLEENKNLRNSLKERNAATDDVVEKLKEVSIETRELIENCEKSSEQTKILQKKSEVLEEELKNMNEQNESMKKEIEQLRKIDWISVISNVNKDLEDFESKVAQCLMEKQCLEHETLKLLSENEILNSKIQDNEIYMTQQNQDFIAIKKTVDKYHHETVRLDSELKALNEKFETLNSENLDLTEFLNFKRCLRKFGKKENVEKLLTKLQILYEIEELFEKKLAPHVSHLNSEKNDNSIDKNTNTIHKIKDYLEKALYAIEKLNEKNLRLTADFENELESKNDEINSLKEILSHSTLYNSMLEQTLKQYKDNAQIDELFEEKTEELITVNKVLLDNYEELREIYRISQHYNEVLFVKYKQLNLFYKIVKINVEKLFQNHEYRLEEEHEPNFAGNIINVFPLIDEVFVEINEKDIDFTSRREDFQRLFKEYETTIAAKDYLKNTVDSMTFEVKRLTSKVEHEMAEKIREIESLRGEMDSIKTDNRELVSKIKNCNREIISLSTENYDLNEKLAVLLTMEKKCEYLKDKLESIKKVRILDDKLVAHTVFENCKQLREEMIDLKTEVTNIQQQINGEFIRITQHFSKIPDIPQNLNNLCALRTECLDFRKENDVLKQQFQLLREQMYGDIFALNHHFINLNSACNSKDAQISEEIQKISSNFDELETKFNSATVEKKDFRNSILLYSNNLLQIITDLRSLHSFVKNFIKEIPIEFSKHQESLMKMIQEAVTQTVAHTETITSLRNEEIIKEMQDMNLELKKRGELISKRNQNIEDLEKEKLNFTQLLEENENLVSVLEKKNSELQATIEEKTSQLEQMVREMTEFKMQRDKDLESKNISLNNLSSVVENLKVELQSKNEIISNLENDISRHRDMQDGDVSSMGTISRTEEVSRLNDVEDSFEERYLKLRCIAVKMKKNIAELTEQLKNEKAERALIQNKLTIAIEQSKRNQALQDECDRITDDLELKCKEIKELKKIIAETDKQNNEMKNQSKNSLEKVDSLLKTESTLKMEKKELENKIKELTSLLENVGKEKSVEEMLKKEYDRQILTLKQKLKEHEENAKKIQNELDQAKFEARKQGALTLEMRDYEKTISDLSSKLKEEQNRNKELDEKLKLSTESNVSLVEGIKQLEDQITSYGASNMIADEQILNLNRLITDQEKNLEEKDIYVKNLKQQLEEEKLKCEKLTLDVASSLAEMNSFKDQCKIKENSLNERLKLLFEKSNSLEEKLQKRENDYDKLKEDFESYKIRAHNALQKHKAENNLKNQEEKLKTEISSLTQSLKELRKRLDDALTDADRQKTELRLVETAKEKLQLRLKEMNETLAGKTKDLDNARMELKSYKLNTETLIQCYKTEIENLKKNSEKLQMELEDLKFTKISNSFTPKEETLLDKVGETTEINYIPESFSVKNSNDKGFKLDNEYKSEFFEKSRKNSMVGLEKLLESDITNEENDNIMELKKNIKLLENQVNYLTGILNESEKSSARNEQQVALLKDEIRRLQKTIERAPHLQNGEYLKNVLFNFFTFPDGDEKCHLITILETLLQLTAEETETLSAIAKGYKVDQKRSSSGLGSMLRLW